MAQAIRDGSTVRIRQLLEAHLPALYVLIIMAIYVIRYIQYPEFLLQTATPFMYTI